MKKRFILPTVWLLWLAASGLAAAPSPTPESGPRLSDERALAACQKGLDMLERGEARSAVLAQWEKTVGASTVSSNYAHLAEYITLLRQQLAEFPKLAASAVENPDSLPPAQRAAYWLDRFPDLRRPENWGESRDPLEEKVLRLGRAALPALIDHLTDRRLTRIVGGAGLRHSSSFWRDEIMVQRVQDRALECLEKIANVRFYPPREWERGQSRYRSTTLFSAEPAEFRDGLVAEIKAWWEASGRKSGVAGRIARLETLPAAERVEELKSIQKAAPKSVDGKALLHQWAKAGTERDLSWYATALADRGDTSLLPALRERWRHDARLDDKLILDYGNADDYGLLADALQKWSLTGKQNELEIFTSHCFFRFETKLTKSGSPRSRLLVPLLVSVLDLRQERTSRRVNGRSQPCVYADIAMDALVAETQHDEGYLPSAERTARFAAIDRWQAWWRKEGRNAFVASHPGTRAAFGHTLELRSDLDPNRLPPLVRVETADPRAPVFYQVPRPDVLALFRSHAIEVQRTTESLRIRFTNSAAEAKWWKSAKPVAPPRHPPGQEPLVRLGDAVLSSPVLGPGQQVWLWKDDSFSRHALPVEEVKQAVERALASGVTVLESAQVLLSDRHGRLWLTTRADHALHGYDRATHEWIERHAPPFVEPRGLFTTTNMVQRAALESWTGDLFFADLWGVHVLQGTNWSYQQLFERAENELPPGRTNTINRTISFAQDADGLVYAWAREYWSGAAARGMFGVSRGTMGCWIFDGKTWTNHDAVKAVGDVVPRPAGEFWVILPDSHLVVVKGGQVFTGEEAQRLAMPNLRFAGASLRGVDAQGTAYLTLREVTVKEPFAKSKARLVAVPRRGEVRDLGSELGELVERAWWSVTWGPDGLIWALRNPSTVEAWNAAGERMRQLPPFPTSSLRRIVGADAQGGLYVSDQQNTWRINATSDQPLDTQEVALPSMHVAVNGGAWPDSLGRAWCVWNTTGHPTARFDGDGWKVFEHTNRVPEGHYSPFRDTTYKRAFQGADGAMVLLESYENRAHFFDRDEHLTATNLEALVQTFPQRLRKAMDYQQRPPPNLGRWGQSLIKDADGNLWWADRDDYGSHFGVVTGSKFILGSAAELGFKKERGSGTSILIPMGKGEPVLWIGPSRPAFLSVKKDHIIKVGEPTQALPGIGWDDYWPMYLRDSQGRFWICDDRSVAVDSTGRQVLTKPARLVFEDSKQGLWFFDHSRTNALTRLDRNGKVASAPGPRDISVPCEARDGTFWVLAYGQLLRLDLERGQLQVVEKLRGPSANGCELWCDRAGHLWIAHARNNEGPWELVCYAMTAKASKSSAVK